MANVDDLLKLNRTKLNEFAEQNGVADASDEAKYVTKKDLAEAVAPNVTPEALESYNRGETVPAPEAETLPTPPIDSPEDVDDQSGVEEAPAAEEEEAEAEEETPVPTSPGSVQTSDEEGMGYPRKDGKTLSILSKKPHETVRNVGGVMVPLTLEEAVGDPRNGIAPKSDAEIIAKLRKMNKL